jgi:hypothetical protein
MVINYQGSASMQTAFGSIVYAEREFYKVSWIQRPFYGTVVKSAPSLPSAQAEREVGVQRQYAGVSLVTGVTGTVAPFSSPIRGTQPGDGCGP